MSITSTTRFDSDDGEAAEQPRRQEKALHPERFDTVAPRRRAHIILIRWTRDAHGDWTYEVEGGQFEAASGRTWTVSNGDTLQEYDMDDWSLCTN